MILSFNPFCHDDSCAIYMTLLGSDESATMEPTGSNGLAFSTQSELTPEGKLKLLPADYKMITAVSCGECPGALVC
uniref:Secreted protein n=1 Tax=Steinernema glaseri TaxID=37863 RepID=A0A1I8A114_9BILA